MTGEPSSFWRRAARRSDLRLTLIFVFNVLAGVVAWLVTTDIRLALIIFGVFALIFVALYFVGKPVLRDWQFHARMHSYGLVAVYTNQAECIARVTSLLETAKNVNILNVRGLGLFALSDSIMRSVLVRRRTQVAVRVLVLDPTSPFVKVRATEVGGDSGLLRNGIQLGMSVIEEMRTSGLNIALRCYSRQPVWRFLMIDDRIFMSAFVPSIEGHEFPVVECIYTGARSLYAILSRQFEEIWKSAGDQVSTEQTKP